MTTPDGTASPCRDTPRRPGAGKHHPWSAGTTQLRHVTPIALLGLVLLGGGLLVLAGGADICRRWNLVPTPKRSRPLTTRGARRSAGWDDLPTRVDLSIAHHSPHRFE
ncbi:hypothetical protein ACWCO0_05395 [Streptomyces tubercidicus]